MGFQAEKIAGAKTAQPMNLGWLINRKEAGVADYTAKLSLGEEVSGRRGHSTGLTGIPI